MAQEAVGDAFRHLRDRRAGNGDASPGARAGEEAGGRTTIAIRWLERPDGLEACQILFVGAAAGGSLDAIVRGTAGKPILLVGDTPGFAGRGVAIELYRKPDIFARASGCGFASTRRR